MSSISSAFLAANRGPLTTVYTPPASCLSTTTIITSMNGSSTVYGDIFINHYGWGDAACYPPTIAIDPVSKTELWANNYYYSPGICPSGWSSACDKASNPAGFTTTLATGTYAALCCPSSYACYEYGDNVFSSHGCSRVVQSNTPVTPVWIPSNTYSSDVPFVAPIPLSITYVGFEDDVTVFCDGIPIIWQDSDTSLFPTSSGAVKTTTSQSSSTNQSKSTSQLSTTSQSSLTIPAATSTSAAPSNTPSGLSTGAKAAIGVTIPIAFLALVLGIFFFFRRRRQHELQVSAMENPGTGQEVHNNVASPHTNTSAFQEIGLYQPEPVDKYELPSSTGK